MISYTWSNPLFEGRADAAKVAQEIAALGDEVIPDQVVEAAKNPDTELHKLFEWDDTKAARLYRKDQARSVLRSIRITYEGDAEPKRVYFNVHSEESCGYMHITKIKERPDASTYLIDRARKDLENWVKRYQEIRHVAGAAFARVDAAVSALRDAVEVIQDAAE